MTTSDRQLRIKALAERSSYVENILRHAFIAELSSIVWKRAPFDALQVFNSEVDDSGFDVVLGMGTQVRYVQLKQTHEEKLPRHCSVRASFAALPGSCVVLMSHTIPELRLKSFRFFGAAPGSPMPSIEAMRATVSPGRRNAAGQRKTRANYRNVPCSHFQGPLSASELLAILFPEAHNHSESA